jgi:hypothetical protein
MRPTLPLFAGGLLLAGAFIALAVSAPPFLQDDAYISFRYVENYLGGDGLVFNRGERVEGYTNFLWIVLLALAAKAGLGLTEAARWLGILFTAGTVVITAMLARHLLANLSRRWLYLGALGAGLWVAVNPALSYWAVAGLETGLFVFLVTLALERLAAGARLGWALLALATLTRPEGALVFAVCLGWYLWREPARIARGWVTPLILYARPLLPFAAFKLWYYGSLLPNPFYAKTGFAPEYWQSGAEYLWLHVQHLGLWGVLPLVLLFGLFSTRRDAPQILPAVLWLVYTVYIIAIGGDVLRAHRFFVPVWPGFAVAVIAGIILLLRRFTRRAVAQGIVLAVVLALAAYQWWYPQEYFAQSRRLEAGIVDKMRRVAAHMQATDDSAFSVAASTIGRLGYELSGHPVIDMLGLTDSTVAKHPETIPGMKTTWKERHFNAGYVLSRDPDYILFSTDIKPSAPAERALILHAKFRRNYYAVMYPDPETRLYYSAHKRISDYDQRDAVWPDLQLADDLNRGLNYLLTNEPAKGIETLLRMKKNGPGDYYLPDASIAYMQLQLGNLEAGLAYADSALAINPYAVSALMSKRDVYLAWRDTAQVNALDRRIAALCPWLVR